MWCYLRREEGGAGGGFESGLDIVVICRVNAKNASYHEIEHALLGLAKKHGIVVENEKKME